MSRHGRRGVAVYAVARRSNGTVEIAGLGQTADVGLLAAKYLRCTDDAARSFPIRPARDFGGRTGRSRADALGKRALARSRFEQWLSHLRAGRIGRKIDNAREPGHEAFSAHQPSGWSDHGFTRCDQAPSRLVLFGNNSAALRYLSVMDRKPDPHLNCRDLRQLISRLRRISMTSLTMAWKCMTGSAIKLSLARRGVGELGFQRQRGHSGAWRGGRT